jgi:phospholipid N-methyltransferase
MHDRFKRPRAIAVDRSRDGSPSPAEYLNFLGAWLRKPRQTASVVPSSRYLARLMVRDIDPTGGRVLEFGGGTGAFTREILSMGLPSDMLEVVEINPTFARGLRRHFPGTAILECPAQTVSSHAAGAPGDYQCIVSGLPLLAMDQPMVKDILAEAFKMLRPSGSMVQFTYSLRPPVPRDILAALDLHVVRAGQTVRNFPPATIFRFTRRGE